MNCVEHCHCNVARILQQYLEDLMQSQNFIEKGDLGVGKQIQPQNNKHAHTLVRPLTLTKFRIEKERKQKVLKRISQQIYFNSIQFYLHSTKSQ